jgi:signal transduction histidine kinase
MTWATVRRVGDSLRNDCNWMETMMPRACLLLLIFCGLAAAQDVLTRAVDIRMLPYERSLEKLPVELTATVGFVESGGTAFVQDATSGTHLHFKPPREGLRAGDIIRVKGTTTAGLYFPGVDVLELETIGHEPPPPGFKAAYDDLASGRYHYQRVLVEGVGRTLSPLDENRSLLRLAMGDRVIEVRVDASLDSAPAILDAGLQITALAAGGINDRRQLVFPYLRVTDWSDVLLVRAARPADQLPVTSVATLLRFGAAGASHHRVRVQGTVLAAFADGRVYLRDSQPPMLTEEALKAVPVRPPQSPTIAIRLTSPVNLVPGHQADITGFPVMAGFSASLADAQVLATTPGPAPAVAEVGLAGFQDGSHDADLIRLNTPAVLDDFFRTADGHELRFSVAGNPLRAFLLGGARPEVELGSSCLLTGVCLVESSTDKGFRSQPERASLLLRNHEDIRILGSAPFWNARRLVAAIAVLAGIILVTLVWITQQRRQIARLQSRIIHQATLDERQRIAREFHDTLEQELAGLSLRLDAAATRPLEDKARVLLDASRSLVSRIQGEARNLVSDLRDTSFPTTLPEALEVLAGRAREHFQNVTLEVMPPPVPLPPHLVHHLRMIAQEAVTNAIKHAQASSITLSAAFDDRQLILRVKDDGRGFAAADETHGLPGHFGCVGIRERCRKIGADVEWQSSPGKGACIVVKLPLHSVKA